MNRSRLARERAGLTIGRAAHYLGIPSGDLLAIEERDSDFATADHTKMCEVYGIRLEWLTGEVPQYDYDAIKAIAGADELTFHDRDILAEFAASMPRITRNIQDHDPGDEES